MSLVAAFLWKKTPESISTLIFDDDNVNIILKPNIHYLPKNFLAFRREAKKIINHFFSKIVRAHALSKTKIKLEYKIVFTAENIPHLTPAKESLFVYKTFIYHAKKTKKRIKNLKIQPQLRRKLSGKILRKFNKQLQHLYLLNRKQKTRYEYNLWAVALHATPGTYEVTLNRIKEKLMDSFWKKAS